MQPGQRNYPLGKQAITAILLTCFTLFANLGPAVAATGSSQPVGDESSTGLTSRLGAFQVSNLVAADAGSLNEFGWSVAISGNTAVVGARSADPDLGQGPISNAGAAYIFIRSGASWVQEARLVPRDAAPGDTFGVSVAIQGNTVVVGSTGSDIEDADNAGSAYIFVREGITWNQKIKLVASDASAEDNFGSAIAIDRNTIVIGANGKDAHFLPDAGAAYVFIQRGTSWDQKAELFATDPRIGAYFGGSVGISGNRIVVGAIEANPTGARGPGAAYVFKGSGNRWQQEARLSAEDSRRGDFFGHSVAISGETIVVGAIFKDIRLGDGSITNAGAAYVFSKQKEDWEQQTMLVSDRAVPFGQFGQSVAVEGNRIVVGAEEETQAGYAGAGAAYLFVQSGKEWQQHTRITADFVYEDDAFGQSVAISGDYVLVGAAGRDPGSSSKAGEAFVYRLAQVQLPDTGFAPGRITAIGRQPAEKFYEYLGDLWLEIPALDVRATLVGVPQGGNGWDTTWLENQAGYLEGTAFPTWDGNTGIAGHNYLPNGFPGPFENLRQLAWGERIIIHAWGQRYIYEVREVLRIQPEDLSVLKHETLDWITLITCRDYDKTSDQYPWRTVVRAVLVAIEDE